MSRPILNGIIRVRCFLPIRAKVGFGKQARHLTEMITDGLIDTALTTVAKTHGVTLPSGDVNAIGDGTILDKLLAFLNEHWDEILALILKLIGL